MGRFKYIFVFAAIAGVPLGRIGFCTSGDYNPYGFDGRNLSESKSLNSEKGEQDHFFNSDGILHISTESRDRIVELSIAVLRIMTKFSFVLLKEV